MGPGDLEIWLNHFEHHARHRRRVSRGRSRFLTWLGYLNCSSERSSVMHRYCELSCGITEYRSRKLTGPIGFFV
jgi:hypothetical protein